MGCCISVFSLATALMHNLKMYGAKKENGDIEIKLTDHNFEPLLKMNIRLLKRSNPYIHLEWGHCSISQNIPDQI